MALALNYASQYARALAQAYPYVLNFGALKGSPNNALYRVGENGKTIYIPSIKSLGRKDVNRDVVGEITRQHENEWEVHMLGFDREYQTLVDPVDIMETNMVTTIQNITKVHNEEQVFPEMDAYMVSKLYAEYLALGKAADTTALTTANVLNIFDNMMEKMDEGRVPQAGRICYVTPAVNKILKQADALNRSMRVNDPRLGGEVSRAVNRLDEVEIIVVPSELMKTAYDFTQGWLPAATAGQINMFLVYPTAVLTPTVFTDVRVDPPAAGTKGKYVYYERSYEDAFIMENRPDGVQFSLTPATTGGGENG